MSTLNYNIEKNTVAGLSSDVGNLQTTDGTRMIDLWTKVIQPGLDAYNEIENNLAQFMAYKSDLTKEEVVQTLGSSWQRGGREVAKSTGSRQIRRFWLRLTSQPFSKYLGWTKAFITKNSAVHITQMFNADLKALTAQKYQEILTAFFTMGARQVTDPDTLETLAQPGLVDGTGNMPIPPNGTNVFPTTHSHFSYVDTTSSSWTNLVNREAAFKALADTVVEHGYRTNLVLLFNRTDSGSISALPGFRQVVTTSEFSVMSPDAALRGLDTQVNIKSFTPMLSGMFRAIGTVENMTCMECDFLPVGYFSVFSYQGASSPENPIHWYEVPVSSFTDNPFPFYETELECEFGACVRKRLNGAVMFTGSGATVYTNPAFAALARVAHDWDGTSST